MSSMHCNWITMADGSQRHPRTIPYAFSISEPKHRRMSRRCKDTQDLSGMWHGLIQNTDPCLSLVRLTLLSSSGRRQKRNGFRSHPRDTRLRLMRHVGVQMYQSPPTVHSASVNGVAWAPHEVGLVFASASSDGSVCVFECQSDGSWTETKAE